MEGTQGGQETTDEMLEHPSSSRVGDRWPGSPDAGLGMSNPAAQTRAVPQSHWWAM